jgi:hypothetical protein
LRLADEKSEDFKGNILRSFKLKQNLARHDSREQTFFIIFTGEFSEVTFVESKISVCLLRLIIKNFLEKHEIFFE